MGATEEFVSKLANNLRNNETKGILVRLREVIINAPNLQ